MYLTKIRTHKISLPPQTKTYTVDKMSLILPSIERILKMQFLMARKLKKLIKRDDFFCAIMSDFTFCIEHAEIVMATLAK